MRKLKTIPFSREALESFLKSKLADAPRDLEIVSADLEFGTGRIQFICRSEGFRDLALHEKIPEFQDVLSR